MLQVYVNMDKEENDGSSLESESVDKALQIVSGYRRYSMGIFVLMAIAIYTPVSSQSTNIVFLGKMHTLQNSCEGLMSDEHINYGHHGKSCEHQTTSSKIINLYIYIEK